MLNPPHYSLPFITSGLTHWGRMTHICVGKLTIIGSDNGLSPGRRQAIIRTNAGMLLIRPLGTNFNEMLIEILTFSFMKMRLKVSSAKWRPFCLGLNVLTSLEIVLGNGMKTSILFGVIIFLVTRSHKLPQHSSRNTCKFIVINVNGPLWWKCTGDRWIPFAKGQ